VAFDKLHRAMSAAELFAERGHWRAILASDARDKMAIVCIGLCNSWIERRQNEQVSQFAQARRIELAAAVSMRTPAAR
jgi:hypothetical protein